MVFTTLIENNRLADKYLHMWAKAGEVIPRTAGQPEGGPRRLDRARRLGHTDHVHAVVDDDVDHADPSPRPGRSSASS